MPVHEARGESRDDEVTRALLTALMRPAEQPGARLEADKAAWTRGETTSRLLEVTVIMVRRFGVSVFILAAIVFGPLRAVPTHAARTAAPTSVSIALNWIKNVEFGGIWAAQKYGWWQQAGLNVTTRAYDYSTDPTVLVGAGKYTFGFQDAASLIIARANGNVPVRAVWASLQKSAFAFITMPNSHITSVRDFKGKRIGYQVHQLYVLQTMLNSVGLNLSDVKLVPVQFDPNVLVVGRVDAYLAFITNEPIALSQVNHIKVNIIPASTYGYTFYGDVLFTTDAVIRSNPALVRKVVAVMDRGWRYALAHPDEMAHTVVPAYDNTGDTVAQQAAEMRALGPLSVASGEPIGSMGAARWQSGISLLLKYKQIHASIPADSVFTTQFLPK